MKSILSARFGFDDFRPRQEAVCDSVASGRDTLVVMPTGAGKSLCYQLPGLARGGTTLVISPLVALIEDQVNRLIMRGMKADRIHSGRTRDQSRDAFRAYLRRELEFLFIAPERLAVPGFADMLRKNPPTLIAVDEAHCISHWGHDFRPDYRLVGERLQGLENTPVVALTATATAIVQKDICVQLRLREPAQFIHGFRRDNLAIRVLDTLPSERSEKIVELLNQPGRVPAIVYAPTRKKAEELARDLKGEVRCAAYHAGMTAPDRERVQQSFLDEKIDVIVATVAFGMGIDKANVRTVVHAALPGSVEGYYQEIGRAGRDGLPSQALLLYSFSDRKTHEFFFDRDHPEPEMLARVWKAVADRSSMGPIGREELSRHLPGMPGDVFEKTLEKLWMHGGLKIDPEENITLGHDQWQKPYLEQRRHRMEQLDAMQGFAEVPTCRMLRLIKHFGDSTDSDGTCKICDRCVPSADVRVLDEREQAVAAMILATLSGRDRLALGRLFDEALTVEKQMSRSGFERLLSALVRARLLSLEQDEFEKDGKVISFRRAELLPAGKRATGDTLAAVEIEGPSTVGASLAKTTPRKRKPKPEAAQGPALTYSMIDGEPPPLFRELRSWRLVEAKKRGIPAFRILSDRILYALCEIRPSSEQALLLVPGIGPKIAAQFGEEILSRIREGG